MALDRSIDSLRPEAAAVCRKWLHVLVDVMGLDVRVHETLRSRARQEALAKTPASRVKLGWHNVGLAWDFGCYDKGRYLTDDASGLYTRCGHIAKALGCVWGGDWKMRDYGHCEYHPGFTLKQFLAAEAERETMP